MTVPAIAPQTSGLLSRLEATGLLVGDGRKPVGGGWQGAAGQSVFVTYLILFMLTVAREGPDASIADRLDAPVLRYQVTAVGQDRRAAQTAGDLAAAQLLNRIPLDIPGRSTVLLIHEGSLGVEVDESVNPPVFTSVERYRLDTTTT